jgi:hypothetical protein
VEFKLGRVDVCRAGLFGLETLIIWAVLFGADVRVVQAGQQAATVRQIAVTGDDHDLDVEITANKPVRPNTQFVTDPDRLIVDLPEARPDAGLRKIAIHRGKLRDIRVGLLSANPPITRVVLDLTSPPEFRISQLANAVTVKLGSEAARVPAPAAATSNPPAMLRPAATTPAVVIAPVEPSSERSWARWIMPILVTTSVLAMLVTALVVNIQNRRNRRGI